MMCYFVFLQDASVREASLRTLGNIAEALHPNRNTLHVILQSRNEMLNQTLSQLHPQYSNTGPTNKGLELYPIVLHVAMALVYPSEVCSAEGQINSCY
jgi:hypothetical protein